MSYHPKSKMLSRHPLVDRCVVVGYDHPKYGESIAAAIILREDEPHYAEIFRSTYAKSFSRL